MQGFPAEIIFWVTHMKPRPHNWLLWPLLTLGLISAAVSTQLMAAFVVLASVAAIRRK